MTFNSTIVLAKVNALASHQSIILGGLALLMFLVALTYVTKSRLTEAQYNTLLRMWFAPAFALGVYSTYAAVYLGYNSAADATTIALLFLGGACGMSLSGTQFPWAWLAAPIVAGYGTMELWGYLAANPSTVTTVGVVALLSMPTFVALLYMQQAHAALGIILVKTRLAFWLALVMSVQAIALAYGWSLQVPLAAAFHNVLIKLGVSV